MLIGWALADRERSLLVSAPTCQPKLAVMLLGVLTCAAGAVDTQGDDDAAVGGHMGDGQVPQAQQLLQRHVHVWAPV